MKYLAGLVMIVIVIPGALLVSSATTGQKAEKRDAEANRKATCAALVDQLVGGLDAFTQQFDGLKVLGAQKIPPMPSMGQLRDEATGLDKQLAEADCRRMPVRDAIGKWRDEAAARGALAEGVRSALAANVLGVLKGSDSPVRRQLRADEDLATALARLTDGATLVLPAGRFVLDRTVAFVQDVTIEGAGAGRTTIASRAQDVGLVLASQVSMRLSGLRVSHRGGGTASVLLLRAGTAELDGVHISGATQAKASAKAAGGALAGGSGIVLAGGQSLMMRDSVSSENAVGGLLVATGAPDVQGSTFKANRVCGVCFVGDAKGQLRDSVAVANGAGVMLGDRSAPVLTRNRIERNSQAGMVIEGSTHPAVRRNTIRANGGIGIAVYAKAYPRLIGNTVSGHGQAGILVDVKAKDRPRIEHNVLRHNGSAGLVFTGVSRGTVSGNTCSGARFGVVLDGSSAPIMRNNRCAVQDQRG